MLLQTLWGCVQSLKVYGLIHQQTWVAEDYRRSREVVESSSICFVFFFWCKGEIAKKCFVMKIKKIEYDHSTNKDVSQWSIAETRTNSDYYCNVYQKMLVFLCENTFGAPFFFFLNGTQMHLVSAQQCSVLAHNP